MRGTTVERLTRNGSPNSSMSGAEEFHVPQRNSPAANTDRDGALVEEVGQVLCATGYPALRDIQIEIERGIVVLWGRVPTYHQKQLAQATAQQVDGIRGIANGIEVVCCR